MAFLENLSLGDPNPHFSVVSSTLNGVQSKWWNDAHNLLYKVDQGSTPSAMIEIVCSNLLNHTTFNDKPIMHTTYTLATTKHQGLPVCCCPSYCTDGWSEFELASLSTDPIKACQQAYTLCGERFRDDLLGVLLFDYALLNKDRHLGNLNLLYRGTQCMLAPMYDNGLSINQGLFLLGDEHPMEMRANADFGPHPCIRDSLLRPQDKLVINYSRFCCVFDWQQFDGYYSQAVVNNLIDTLDLLLSPEPIHPNVEVI